VYIKHFLIIKKKRNDRNRPIRMIEMKDMILEMSRTLRLIHIIGELD